MTPCLLSITFDIWSKIWIPERSTFSGIYGIMDQMLARFELYLILEEHMLWAKALYKRYIHICQVQCIAIRNPSVVQALLGRRTYYSQVSDIIVVSFKDIWTYFFASLECAKRANVLPNRTVDEWGRQSFIGIDAQTPFWMVRRWVISFKKSRSISTHRADKLAEQTRFLVMVVASTARLHGFWVKVLLLKTNKLAWIKRSRPYAICKLFGKWYTCWSRVNYLAGDFNCLFIIACSHVQTHAHDWYHFVSWKGLSYKPFFFV